MKLIKNSKHFKLLIDTVVLWSLIAIISMSALAAEPSTFSCFQLSVSSDGNVVIETTATGWKVSAYGTDGSCSSTYTQTVTFTITNTGTKSDGSARAVDFKITTTGMITNSTSEAKTLDSTTTSLTYTATSGKGSSAYTTITIDFADISQESLGASVETTVKAVANATVSVDGSALTADTTFSKLDSETYTLTAAPSTGYTVFGWMSDTGYLDISGATTLTYEGKNANTVWPLIIKSDSAVYYIKDASPVIYYGYLDDAATAAGASGTIVLYKSGTVYGRDGTTLSLNGQTLLIPYSASDLSIDSSTSTDESGSLNSTWQYANVAFTSDNYDDGNASNGSVTGVLEPAASLYLTLTIPSGTTVNINSGSKVVIGGTIVSGTSNTGGVCGATAGAHSNLEVNGTLNINSGGILSACGYVLGSGSVNITGGSAYQPFVMMDYHDGHYTANSTKNANFPIYRYSLQNIRPCITMSQNGKMFGYVDIYTQETSAVVTTIKARHNVACVGLIGDSDDEAIIQLATSDATVSATYDASDYVTTTSGKAGSQYYSKAGKTKLTINGGATLGNLSISVYVPILGAQTSSSSSTDFPVPYYYDITLENGTYTLSYTLVLYPGASMHVAEDANLVISGGEFVALDGLRDYSSRSSSVTIGSWYEYHYPSTDNFKNNHSKGTYTGTSNLIVDGTLTVNDGAGFGGYVQTNGTGKVVMNGIPSATIGVGNVVCYGTPVNKYVGRTEHTLKAWLYEADGDLIEMTTGTTYYGVDAGNHTIDSYDYIVYTTANDTSTYTTVNDEALNAQIIGSWCTADGHSYGEWTQTKASTCTEAGEETRICACGAVETREVSTTGHNYSAVVTVPTCTTDGYTTHTCSVCGDSYTDSVVTASHSWTVATCTKTKTCTVCGETEGDALGHDYVTEEFLATCTAPAYTKYTCSVCGGSYLVISESPALGHTYGDDNICDVCGTSQPQVTFEVKHNLNLLDLVQIGYWVKATPADETITIESYGIQIWDMESYLAKGEPYEPILKERSGYWQGYGEGIYAQELDAVYCAIPYVVTSAGDTIYSDTVDIFSVPMYAASSAFGQQTAEVQTVVRDLLNYAANAQYYFLIRNEGYTETTIVNRTPINSVLSDEMQVSRYSSDMLVTDSDKPVVSEDGSLACTWYSTTINLEEAICLNFYAYYSSEFDGMLYLHEDKFTAADMFIFDANNALTLTSNSENTLASAKIKKIYAKDIGDWYYGRMYSEVDGSYSYGPIRVDSVAAYLSRGIEAGNNGTLDMDDSENKYMVLTFQNMLAYGKSAEAYAATVGSIA